MKQSHIYKVPPRINSNFRTSQTRQSHFCKISNSHNTNDNTTEKKYVTWTFPDLLNTETFVSANQISPLNFCWCIEW